MNLITKSIKHGVSFAYISLLMDCSNIFTSPLSFAMEEMDKDLGIIIEDMKKMFSSLDTLIGDDEISRSESVVKLQSHHKILENKYKVLNGYSRELNHISTVLENKYHLKTTALEEIEGINYHQFIHEALDFISQAENEKDKTYKLREVLRFIPMRMTKDSFAAYIKQSLHKVSPGENDKDDTIFLSVFKQMFDGRFTQNYNEAFYDLAMAIEDMREKSKADLNSVGIEELFDDIYLLKDTIEELYKIITTLHTAVSEFSTLFILDNLNFDILSAEHIAFKDLFLATRSLVTGESHGEDYNILVETLPDRIDDIYDEINEYYSHAIAEFNSALKKGSLPQTEETLKSIKILSLIRFYLLLDIQDAFSFNESTDEASQLPEATINSAIEFLKEQLEILKPTERKLRMQYLISMLPITMNTQQFADYFNSGLEGTSNEIQKAYVLAKISNFMDSFGYFEDQVPHEHLHDEHHDCECHESN